MSLILDALRRAEREHPRDLARHVSTHTAPPATRRRSWRPVMGVAAFLLVLVLAAWWFLRQDLSQSPPVPPATPLPTVATPSAQVPERSVLDAIELDAAPVAAPATPSSAPFLHDLPRDVRGAVPEMTLNAHVWSDDPGRRFVVIDMRRYRDGDTVAPGLRLVRVLPEGVEMDWRGTRFRVGR